VAELALDGGGQLGTVPLGPPDADVGSSVYDAGVTAAAPGAGQQVPRGAEAVRDLRKADEGQPHDCRPRLPRERPTGCSGL
jgi:hypothetical protein